MGLLDARRQAVRRHGGPVQRDGSFLQKTNIIRDYLEDIVEEPAPRMFWPKCVWSKYAKTLDAFQYPENREKAVTA